MSSIKIAVFASGHGSNCRALYEAIISGKLNAEIGLIVSNNPDAGVLTWAKEKELAHIHISSEQFDDKLQFHHALLRHLALHHIQMIVLAGYMKKIGLPLIEAYPNKILNIHPALLPSFGGKGMYGEHVHKAIIDYGAKITGVTVHLVDPEYDHGAIVMQKALEVSENDTPQTLAQRVLALEHQTYYRALQLFAENKVIIKDRKVFLSRNI
ncbi:phosphoribosylglycinamide formyltransferase [bacterium]|nr:phosphoribosylglycinamide formyltransferase [bacterium]